MKNDGADCEVIKLINKLGIKDAITGETPSDKDDLRIIEMQLKIAAIILRDSVAIHEQNHTLPLEQIIKSLAQNWSDNISDFAYALQRELQ